jgi:hypothetical protein
MFENAKDETISTVIRAAFILVSMGGEGEALNFPQLCRERRNSMKRKTDTPSTDGRGPRKKSGAGSFVYDASESVL